MAEHAEALAQLARLLDDEGLRYASLAAAGKAASSDLSRLAEALTSEAAANDDVFDRESAIEYLESRLGFLEAVIADDDRRLLEVDLRHRVENW